MLSESICANVLKDRSVNSHQINIVLRAPEDLQHAEEGSSLARKSIHESSMATWFAELDELIGLEKVKELVHEIYAMIHIRQYRSAMGLKSHSLVYHMIFSGNPGTGKTTVARMIAKMFQKMGILSKGHLVEVERADMVGEYIGHTALKTRDLIKKAMGGILFIDEAYSLARGGDKDFGKEAIDCLVRSMENHKTDFILILAGYASEMNQFLQLNPGLPSRFPIQLEFEDYSIEECLQIANVMAIEREYMWHASTQPKLKHILKQEKERNWKTFSNARFVRNMVEKAIRNQAVRLLNQYTTAPAKLELMYILPDDVHALTKA
jgi:stage V sporulation protein K